LIKKISPVTDADVEARLTELRESNAKLAPATEDAVSDKHFAAVDYEATLDGKPVEGGKAQDQLVEIAAPQSLAGFNDALKGMKVGETKDAVITFPAEHPNKALAGKGVNFHITVKELKEKRLPAADDEFAKDVGVESFAMLKEKIQKNLEAQRTREQREDLERQAIEALLERHPFEVPASLVESRAKDLTERLKSMLMSQGASPADWSVNEPKMLERNRPEAEKQVRLSYLLVEIANKEKIEASEADVDKAVEKAVNDVAEGKREEMRKWFAERRENLRAQLKEEKLFDFLIQNGQVTEQNAAEKR
jgi:trigger factor